MFARTSARAAVAGESERRHGGPPRASGRATQPAWSYLAPRLEHPSESRQRKCGPCTAEDEMIASSGPQHRRLVPTSDPAEQQADELGARIGAELGGVSVGPGPLSPRAQRIAERHLGVSLDGTRIADEHTGHHRATGERALAVTEGSDISFRRGQLTTATPAGRALIGHELTHVAQQRSARTARTQKFDPLGAIGSLAGGAANVGGDILRTGANLTGDALSTGFHVAGDVATGDFAAAGRDLGAGASSALGHVVTGAESASTHAATGVAGATNALLGDFGVHAGVSGTGLSVAVDDIELFDSFDIPIIDAPEWSTFIPLIGGAIPVGPVVLGGALGFMVRVKPQLMGSLGPGWLRNISVVFDPLHLTTTATAQLYVAGAIGPRVALSGALAALGGIAIPDPPILVIAGVEGGLRGTGRGSALAALQITVSGGFTGGSFSFKADNRLRFGVHLMGSLDAYVAATLYNKIICEYVWRLLQWSGGPAWELSIPLSMSGLSRPKIGPVGFGRFPIGDIEHGITEPPTGRNCMGWDEIKKILCEVGVIPPEHCKDKDGDGGDGDDDDAGPGGADPDLGPLDEDVSCRNPPGCTPDRCRALQIEVKRLCNQKFSCKGQEGKIKCKLAATYAERAEKCANQRKKINDECFKGGDKGHKRAERDARQAARTCKKMIKDKQCVENT